MINSNCKHSEMPLNNEAGNIASFKNKDESKLSEKYSSNNILSPSQLIAKEAVGNNSTTDHIYGQELNNFYTEKFERLFRETVTTNSESSNYEKMNNASENNSFDHNLVGNRITTNIFPQKISESELSSDQPKEQNSNFGAVEVCFNVVERKAQAKKLPDNTKDMTGIIAAPTMGNNFLHGTNNVSGDSEYETHLSGEYEIFKTGPSREASTTEDKSNSLLNEREQESRHRPGAEILEANEKNLHLKSPKTSTVKDKEDFKLSITKLKNGNYLAKDIFPELFGEYLHTGITQTKVLQCLRDKGIPGTVPKLTKDIKAFFDDATKAGVIKKQNRRFYLNFVDDTATQNAQQSLKRKFPNDNNNSKHYNYVEDNMAHKRKKLASSLITASKSGPSTSSDEAENSDLTKIPPMKNTIQSKTEKVRNQLKKHKIKSSRKNDEVLQHPGDDFTKAVLLNMINRARSRREGIKFQPS